MDAFQAEICGHQQFVSDRQPQHSAIVTNPCA
jgi:hypothetical protein